MKVKVHRAIGDNGGNCVEIFSDRARIVLDMGVPIVFGKAPGESQRIITGNTDELLRYGMLPNIRSLFGASADGDSPVETALLVSRAQLEKDVLADFVGARCQVWTGKTPRKFWKFLNIFRRRDNRFANARHYETETPFTVGDLTVTPFLLDRSAFDAYAFLIDHEGKTLLYSGDLRNLDGKKAAFMRFLEIAPKKIDYLLLENDALTTGAAMLPTEDDIEREFINIFQEKANSGGALVYISGQNIDRLVSIYKACQACRRLLVMDLYFATVFLQLTNLGMENAPEVNTVYPGVKVWYPQKFTAQMHERGYDKIPLNLAGAAYRYSVEDIVNHAAETVMLVRPSMIADLENLDIFSESKFISGGVLIHSLWQGYQQRSETRDFVAALQRRGLNAIRYVHASGRADLTTIRKILEAVQPRCLAPINVVDIDKCRAIADTVEVIRIEPCGEFTV